MPLEVANQPNLLPTGLLSANLNAFVSPAENIVHGYNMTEQTCFHKTTVSNVIPGFSRLSAFVREVGALLQPVTALLSAATSLIGDAIRAVGLTRTLLSTATTVVGAVTAIVGTVTTLVGTAIGLLTTVIGLVTTIISTLGGIATACLVAGIATIAAGVLFGFGFVGAGGIALTVLLTIVFFVIRGAIMTIATALTSVTGALASLNTALGTLTAPLGTLSGALGPLNTAIGAVDGILENAALPSDVTRSLNRVSTALTGLQTALAVGGSFETTLASTTMTLDQRTDALRKFLVATPAGQPKTPRASLEDTYQDALTIYRTGVAATRAASVPVWDVMRATPINAPQVEPGGVLDTTLNCPVEFRQG
jgi:hypothetical protein